MLDATAEEPMMFVAVILMEYCCPGSSRNTIEVCSVVTLCSWLLSGHVILWYTIVNHTGPVCDLLQVMLVSPAVEVCVTLNSETIVGSVE